MIWATYRRLRLHRPSKWSSLLWTVMSYLFSWRGYWEMIRRWRSVPFFWAPQGERKWQCGTREGRAAEYQIFQHKFPGWPDVEQRVSTGIVFRRNMGVSLTFMFLSVLCSESVFFGFKRGLNWETADAFGDTETTETCCSEALTSLHM